MESAAILNKDMLDEELGSQYKQAVVDTLEARVIAEKQRKNRTGTIDCAGALGLSLLADALSTAYILNDPHLGEQLEESNKIVGLLMKEYGVNAGLMMPFVTEMGLATLLLRLTENAKNVGKGVRALIGVWSLEHIAAAVNNTILASHPDGNYSALERAYINMIDTTYSHIIDFIYKLF